MCVCVYTGENMEDFLQLTTERVIIIIVIIIIQKKLKQNRAKTKSASQTCSIISCSPHPPELA